MATDSVVIRWFPPSWLQIQAAGKVIYIDPAWIQKNFASYPRKVIFSHYPEPIDGLPEPDLPKADYICITHHHQDHVKTVTLNRLATNTTKIYAPPKCADIIGRKFIQIKPGDAYKFDGIDMRVVYAYNTFEGRSTHKVHHRGECVGYLLKIYGKTIYHAGDTDVLSEMKEFGEVDIAFLPIGGTFTMDVEEAVVATRIIRPKFVMPMHYLKANPLHFVRKAKSMSAVRCNVLSIGEQYVL